MGLSIHYSGSIKDIKLIPALVDEVQDVCKELNWTYHLFNDKDFKGICFSPPECEPVFLTFNNGTEIICPVKWQYKIEPMNIVSTKTQSAGIEVHITLLKLLRYLKEKYFSVFDMEDEGSYWNTWDEEALQKQFNRYHFLLNAFAETLKDFKGEPGESAESLADRLEKFLGESGEQFKEDASD
jgi:hypothetical protein